MTDFLRLLNDVADEKNSTLSSVLMKAKILGSRLRSRAFRKWVREELDGYDSKESLPDYRVISVALIGDFSGYFNSSITNVPLSTTGIPKEWKHVFERRHVTDNIGELEALCDTDADALYSEFDTHIVQIFRQHSAVQADGYLLRSLRTGIAVHALRGVLHAIRSRLLDFLLELREQHPELEDDSAAVNRVPEEEVSRIAQTVLYDGCTIHEGDSYVARQAGAIGPNAKASRINQVWNDHRGKIDLSVLADELATLRGAMREVATSPEQDIAVAGIAKAEASARKGDGAGTVKWLKSGGKWAYGIAEKIGVTLTASMIKAAIEGKSP